MKSTVSINQILIIAIVIIVLINAVVLFNFVFSRNVTGNSYAMRLTDPILSLTAVVRDREGDTLFVDVVRNSTISPEPVTLKVRVADRTTIFQTPVHIPYSFTQASATEVSGSRATLSEIATGSTITITSESDLRFLQSDSFVAQSITIPPEAYIISGIIGNASAGTISVQGIEQVHTLIPGGNPATEKTYTIEILPQTEIVQIRNPADGSIGLPIRKSATDLKPGDRVTVYFERGQSETNVTGKLIQQQAPATPVSPAVSPLPSTPTTSPTAIPTRSN